MDADNHIPSYAEELIILVWKCTHITITLLSFGDLQKLLEKHLSKVAILCILN